LGNTARDRPVKLILKVRETHWANPVAIFDLVSCAQYLWGIAHLGELLPAAFAVIVIPVRPRAFVQAPGEHSSIELLGMLVSPVRPLFHHFASLWSIQFLIITRQQTKGM
jgi:hypothetical protein